MQHPGKTTKVDIVEVTNSNVARKKNYYMQRMHLVAITEKQ